MLCEVFCDVVESALIVCAVRSFVIFDMFIH